jgi:hypothetical protein
VTELNSLSGSPEAIRQRRHRQRKRRGRRTLNVEIQFEKFVWALFDAGLLDEKVCEDIRSIEFCAGQILDEWARRWVK